MIRVVLLFTLLAAAFGTELRAQTPAPPLPSGSAAQVQETRWFLRNWTRVESWHYFDPNPGGGDPDYTDIANRLQLGVEHRAPRYDVSGAIQYVQFGGLPTGATGPGPLGTGALYFDQSGRTDSHQVYLRYLNLRLKAGGGLTVQAGRFGYTSGAESPSGDPKIETVKRLRLDSRLIGEFEWALYQRAFDGVRADLDRPRWHATASAVRPTQGGFEDAAGAEITRIDLVTGAVTLKPGSVLRHTDWQLFANRYNDTRPVQARPDNTNTPATAVDVHINTFGSSVAGVYPKGSGQIDVVGWIAVQTGTWYGQSHRASAQAGELGYQWSKTAWRPWLRAGFFRASGDAGPADNNHGTFVPIMPTVRKYSLSTVYSMMNLDDVFVHAFLNPSPKLNVRVDLHRLALVTSEDRWYSGSGATQKTGTNFGYAGRRSNGATSLGTMFEGSTDRAISRHWSVNGYVGVMKGGDVVRRTFAGGWLTFVYLESVVQF
ncbi:MAG: alginate export family protein [Aromatoleum sp.]|nr:alginate export family protein [Aromatoleum sp.]